MGRRSKCTASAVTVAVALGLAAGPASAGQPVRLVIEARATPGPAAECVQPDGASAGFGIRETGHGTGNAAVGGFTWQSKECVTVDPPTAPAPPTLRVYDGRFRITARGGDALCGTYAARGSSLGLLTDEIHLTVWWTAEGGTGRFVGATGGGTGSAVVTGQGQDVVAELEGAVGRDTANAQPCDEGWAVRSQP